MLQEHTTGLVSKLESASQETVQNWKWVPYENNLTKKKKKKKTTVLPVCQPAWSPRALQPHRVGYTGGGRSSMCEAAGLQAAVQVGSSPVQLVLSVIQSLLHAVRKQEQQESANFNFLKSKYSFLLVIFFLRKYI